MVVGGFRSFHVLVTTTSRPVVVTTTVELRCGDFFGSKKFT